MHFQRLYLLGSPPPYKDIKNKDKLTLGTHIHQMKEKFTTSQFKKAWLKQENHKEDLVFMLIVREISKLEMTKA